MTTDPLLLTGGAVHTGRRVLEPGWVVLSGGRVAALGAGQAPGHWQGRARTVVDTSHATVVPGFVDLHCHGGGGATFGGEGQPSVTAAEHVARTHREQGTTTLVASLVTERLSALQRSVATLAGLVQDGLLAGVHLEGPWLNPAHRGAHDAALLQVPSRADLARVLDPHPGVVAVVTLAPELPGGLDAIRQVVDAGAVAAFGHSDADADQTAQAVTAGVRLATHLFNAMRPIHHRAPGPVPVLLADERVTVELIADGAHLHPLILAHAARSVGPARTVLVTDAMAAAASTDGRYLLGGLEVDVRHGRATLAENGALAGSTLTADAALRHAVHGAGIPLTDALAGLTTTPAAVLGRADVGHLEVGARADVVVLDGELRVREVVAGGRRLRRAS